MKTVDNFTPSGICNEIVEMIKSKKGSDAEIEIITNLGYSSIKFLGIHSLRVTCGRKNYIGLKNSYEHVWANNESIKIERIPSDELWSRVSFNSQEDLKNLHTFFLQLYEEAFSLLNVELFSCCSRYIQCSDEKVCIQPNKRLSVGCQYRKNLESGRIFYGKNRDTVGS